MPIFSASSSHHLCLFLLPLPLFISIHCSFPSPSFSSTAHQTWAPQAPAAYRSQHQTPLPPPGTCMTTMPTRPPGSMSRMPGMQGIGQILRLSKSGNTMGALNVSRADSADRDTLGPPCILVTPRPREPVLPTGYEKSHSLNSIAGLRLSPAPTPFGSPGSIRRPRSPIPSIL
ncbi:hypothetical protein lerEdw1_007037 [Lerista edwardsae]|nr:hypothetical protein lerEdw1_007037 [Lerista edwardsae]